MKEPILAGYGKVEITPKKGAGSSFEILDPIFMRVLHVRQGDRQVTFLTADLFALDDCFVSLVRDHLGDLEVDSRWMLCGASHLGTGPVVFTSYVAQPSEMLRQFGRDDYYATLAAEAIRIAVKDLAAAQVSVHTAEAPQDLSYNRRAHDRDGQLAMVSLSRYPQPPADFQYDATDRHVGIVTINRPGKRRVALVNYGCHALSMWDQRGHISGDFPGRMCQMLDAEGVDALFYQGALGNVHPVRRGEQPCDRIARALAEVVQSAAQSPERVDDIRLADTTVEISAGRQLPVAEAKALWQGASTEGQTTEGLARYRYWLAQRYAHDRSYAYPLRAVTMGSSVLLHMPGEPFVETVAAIRRSTPFENVLVLANPCPEVGYLPTREQHEEGGDEPRFAPLEFDAESLIREAAIELLNRGTVESSVNHPA